MIIFPAWQIKLRYHYKYDIDMSLSTRQTGQIKLHVLQKILIFEKNLSLNFFKSLWNLDHHFFFLDGTIIIIVLETFNNENKMYEIKYINSM